MFLKASVAFVLVRGVFSHNIFYKNLLIKGCESIKQSLNEKIKAFEFTQKLHLMVCVFQDNTIDIFNLFKVDRQPRWVKLDQIVVWIF